MPDPIITFLKTRPNEARKPELKKLPDGRFRLERYFDTMQWMKVAVSEFRQWGILDEGPTVTGTDTEGLAGLRLVDAQIREESIHINESRRFQELLVLSFEQIPETAEVQAGGLRRVTDENGRDALEATFLQFVRKQDGTANSEVPGTNGQDTAPGRADCVLSGGKSSDDGCLRTITRNYIEAGDTWERIGPDKTDRDMNGLLRVRRLLIAKAGTTPPELTVGTTSYVYGSEPTEVTCYLGTYTDEGSDKAVSRILASYLQPGVISKRQSSGPVAGTTENSWQTWRVDATNATDMTNANAGAPIPGVLITRGTENVQGFTVNAFTSVSGTITGVKTTYADTIDVRTPGTVGLTAVAVTVGGLTGTLAVINHTPPRTKTIAATVTIEITTAPPNTAALAFDLGEISCSVTATRAAYNNTGTDVFETSSIRASYPRQSASISASIQTFPDCYLLNASAAGSFTYDAGYQNTSTSPTSIVAVALESIDTTSLTGTGATGATGYNTNGIIQRKARPVFTALNGTIYWEVVTWSV